MNNNNNSNRGNNNNNRRRGRNNRPGNNGGQQLNRIDSRARGNAPQLLEKYRKLAQDAHLNGDRVTAEYYLQFADHYFRVLADARVRHEETRRPQGERWQESAEDESDSSDFSADSDFPSFEQPVYQRREAEERPRREDGNDKPRREEGNDRPRREGGNDRPRRDDNAERAPRAAAGETAVAAPQAAPAEQYEPAENPFVRDNRGSRGLRPRRDDRRPPQGERPAGDAAAPAAGLDPSLLPPAITVGREPAADVAEPEAAKPKRRVVRRKPAAESGDEAGGALEVAG